MARNELDTLILKLIENNISDQDVRRLEQLFSTHPHLIEHYCEFTMAYASVQLKFNAESIFQDKISDDSVFDEQLWQELAESEKTALAVDIPTEEPHSIQNVERPLVITKAPKRSNIPLFFAAAVVLFFVVCLLFDSTKVEVATLTDSYDAKIFDSYEQLYTGARLTEKSDSIWLEKGIVTIDFDQGVQVVIEAPAEFELHTVMEMTLHSGRLYARVSERANGFVVDTPAGRIVDLGTEFGVYVSKSGISDIHMMKGRASLSTASKGRSQPSIDLVSGQAKRMSSTGKIQDIRLNKTAFVRAISSKADFVWRGEHINLADIVGGGNGFGTGVLPQGIDLNTGEPRALISSFEAFTRKDTFYHPAQTNPYVDGVFVPDGEFQPVQITSTGIEFEGCPDTCGLFYYDVLNGSFGNALGYKQTLVFHGVDYGTLNHPCISLHANAGVTFDLQAIRRSVPGTQIQRFTSLVGISEVVSFKELAMADIWVLIDGELVYEKERMTPGQVFNVDVEIAPTARFLTLISTDSGPIDEDRQQLYPEIEMADNKSDWCFFANPYLILEGE